MELRDFINPNKKENRLMFDHYIAVDWAQKNMAIARMTACSNKVTVIDVPSNIKELQLYLKQLKGEKVLCFEESTASQWLYTELREYVDELIVCDPYRNHLLKEGAKSDKIDATKLVNLLRAGLLKPVFHSGDEFIHLRKLVSGYMDLVKAGVRLKNQRAALFRSSGKEPGEESPSGQAETFVLDGLDRAITSYEREKSRYVEEFKSLSKKYKSISLLKSLPGIRDTSAVKIAALVVDPRRFPTPHHFWSYCGLIKHDRISGGRSYGKKSPRCCRLLKGVFKTAAFTSIGEGKNNQMREYYLHLINEKKLVDYNARNKVARRIATLAWGILKSGKRFDPYRREKCKKAV
jgi:hypothetical protein